MNRLRLPFRQSRLEDHIVVLQNTQAKRHQYVIRTQSRSVLKDYQYTIIRILDGLYDGAE